MFCRNQLYFGMRRCLLSGYLDHELNQQEGLVGSEARFNRSLRLNYLV